MTKEVGMTNASDQVVPRVNDPRRHEMKTPDDVSAMIHEGGRGSITNHLKAIFLFFFCSIDSDGSKRGLAGGGKDNGGGKLDLGRAFLLECLAEHLRSPSAAFVAVEHVVSVEILETLVLALGDARVERPRTADCRK